MDHLSNTKGFSLRTMKYLVWYSHIIKETIESSFFLSIFIYQFNRHLNLPCVVNFLITISRGQLLVMPMNYKTSFFFWWVNTEENILIRKRKPEGQPKAYKKYTAGAKMLKRAKTGGKTKNRTRLHLIPINQKSRLKIKG